MEWGERELKARNLLCMNGVQVRLEGGAQEAARKEGAEVSIPH